MVHLFPSLRRALRAWLPGGADERLQESERRYIELVEQAITGFVVRRPDGQLILVNEAYRRMTGYSREELLQLKARDLVADPSVLEVVSGLKPGESALIETLMKCKGGATREVQYVTQRRQDGNLQSVLVDISERKRIERAKDESEQRYAELVDQALEGIMVRDSGGHLMFVNDAFCRMLGYLRDELLRLNIRDVVHPDDAETIQHIEKLSQGGRLQLHKRMLRKDGGVIYVEVSAKRLQSGDIQTTIQDVSARKHAELRFRTMVEGSPTAMIMADERGRIVLANPQAERLFGYSREELEGASAEMLVPAKLRSHHPALREGYQRDPHMRAMGAGRDLFGVHKDGREVPVEIGLNPIETPEGRFVLASVIDITERKRAEAREREYMEELRLMSQQLLEAQETERRAIARELHDEVGQSLTATRINLRDLEQQAEGSPLQARLADSSAIIAELLAKVRQMSLDLHPSVLDDLGLGAALRWCARTRTVGSSMQVTLHVPEELPRFAGQVEITLFRVFQESLSNAMRHAQAAHFTADVSQADGRVSLKITDDGRGFDAVAARKHAFSGKSLGLVGMQERVRLAGGEISVESDSGKGTRIRVSLPDQGR